MIQTKGYDYEDVRVVVDSKYVTYTESDTPDLSFTLGAMQVALPIVLYYDSPEGNSAMEKACADNGILTAGPMGSKIALPLNEIEKLTYGDEVGFKLFEAFAPLSLANQQAMKDMIAAGNKLVVGCSVSPEHAKAAANELKLASAVLVGPTQVQTTHRLESIGLAVPRVTLIEEVVWGGIDVPVIATASSPADVCKALIAGADAVLIHFGGPFEPGDNLDFAVKAVADSLRETLTELCLVSGAKKVRELATRCKLTPQ
jgi:hypothetical protein